MNFHERLAKLGEWIRETLWELNPRKVVVTLLCSGLLAFGLYNIHDVSGVTEGGILGLTLLLDHWLHISPAISGFVLSAACYLAGWKLLGRRFLAYSAVATTGFSVFYGICELFDPLWPGIADHPLLAALAGALFVGVSCGLCVRMGGAPSGDDALAMCVAKVTGARIQWVYMACDLVVLGLSLSYIPLSKIAYSLLTVTISGQLVGLMQRIGRHKTGDGSLE